MEVGEEGAEEVRRVGLRGSDAWSVGGGLRGWGTGWTWGGVVGEHRLTGSEIFAASPYCDDRGLLRRRAVGRQGLCEDGRRRVKNNCGQTHSQYECGGIGYRCGDNAHRRWSVDKAAQPAPMSAPSPPAPFTPTAPAALPQTRPTNPHPTQPHFHNLTPRTPSPSTPKPRTSRRTKILHQTSPPRHSYIHHVPSPIPPANQHRKLHTHVVWLKVESASNFLALPK